MKKQETQAGFANVRALNVRSSEALLYMLSCCNEKKRLLKTMIKLRHLCALCLTRVRVETSKESTY